MHVSARDEIVDGHLSGDSHVIDVEVLADSEEDAATIGIPMPR